MAKSPRPPATAAQAGVDSKLDLGNANPTRSDEIAIDKLLDEVSPAIDENTAPAPPADTDLKEPAPPSDASNPSPDAPGTTKPGDPTPENPVVGKAPIKAPIATKATVAPINPEVAAKSVEPKPVQPKDDIDSIKDPANASPEALNSFKAMREVSKKYKKEIGEVSAKLTTLETQLKEAQNLQGKMSPELEARVAKANEILLAFDIESHPQFKEQYGSKMEKLETDIYGLLKQANMPDDKLKAFIDGKGVQSASLAWWKKEIIDPLKAEDDVKFNELGVAIEARVDDFHKTNHDKKEAIANASKTGSEFMNKRAEEYISQQKEEHNRMKTVLEQVQATYPYARLQEIPADATPEQRAQIEEDNAFYKESEQNFPLMLNPPTPEIRIQTVCMALAANRLASENEKASKIMEAQHQRVQALESELSKLKSVGRTNNMGNAAPAVGSTPKNANKMGMKNEAAIEATMQEMGI